MIERPNPVGKIVASLRQENGMSQEALAEAAGVDRRTIQRLESGDHIRPESAKAVAQALGVPTPQLYGPRSVTALVQLAEEMTCEFCGAPIVQQGSVDYQNVDVDCEVFGCGAEIGLRFRPCPKDPRFPVFTDYEIQYFSEGDMVYCYAQGKTDMARAVHVSHGFGRTEASAIRMLERFFIESRDGYEAAERFYPLSTHE